MKNNISKHILTLLLIVIFSYQLIAQVSNGNVDWQPLYDSLLKHSQLKDQVIVDRYAAELFTPNKYQIHDSLRVMIGVLTAGIRDDEIEALKFLRLSESILLQSGKNQNLLGWNYFYTADWYYNKFQDKKALTFFLKADSLFTAINRKSFMSSMTKVGICDVLMNSGFNENPLLLDQILPYIDEGLKVSDSLGYDVPSAILLYKKGVFYFAKEELEQSEYYYKKSLHLSKKNNNDIRQSLIYEALAKIFLKRNQLDSAVVYQEKAVEISKKINDLKVVSSVNIELGRLYNLMKNYDDAIKHLDLGKEILRKSNSSRKELYHNIENNLAEAYFGKGEFKKGYLHLKAAKKSMQEAQQIKNSERVEEIEAKYQAEKKEQEITLLKSQNLLVEQQNITQRYIFIGSIAILSLVGLFFFFLYRNRQKTTLKLQELDKAKSIFFANISHEFRTPLTMISGPLQNHLQKEDLKEEDRSIFKMMHRNTTRLLALVNQLLDISKIESGRLKLKISKNNIIPFIGMLADSFTFQANQKKIDYQVNITSSELDTYFDADILEKIIVNLLSNALKYTPENGSIICDAFIKKEELHFSVINSGKALSEAEIKNIFERFYQINEDAQGAGIGLALVKELVILHKGKIEVKSKSDKGTTFKIVLPISKNTFAKNEFAPPQKSELGHANINSIQPISPTSTINNLEKEEEIPVLLVVDDNADIRTYVSSLFDKTYKILEAKNGQEGVDIAIEQIPDIIISDIMMPIKNGIYLCNQLKEDERTSHVPIILLTAKAGEENEIEGIKTGADDYVTKPFSEKLLKIRVENLIENRKKLQLRYSQKVIFKPKEIAITSIDEQFLERLQNVLDSKLTEPTFSIQYFSNEIGMSRMQLHRKLKALTGLSASEFIRTERLKLAAQLLKKSKINVSEAGFKVGFNDHAYFSKCFKIQYHCTPSEYVKTSQDYQ